MQSTLGRAIARISARQLGVYAAFAVLLLGSQTAQAIDEFEWDEDEGDWSDPDNWFPPLYGGPTELTTAVINNGGTARITSIDVTVRELLIAHYAPPSAGRLEITGGGSLTVTSAPSSIGSGPPSNGSALIAGANSLLFIPNHELSVGAEGWGTLAVTTGGTFRSNEHISLAAWFFGYGTINIGDGGAPGIIDAPGIEGGDGVASLNFDHTDSSYIFSRDGTGSALPVDITGSTIVNHYGSGTTILIGDYTYTGGTTIDAGTLQIGNGGTSGSIAGDIDNDSALVFDRSDDWNFDGEISGSGSVTKEGAGTLTFTADQAYTGATTVADGTLRAEGLMTGSEFTVGADGTLGGSGTLGQVTVNGGTVAPGAGVGTLTTGDLTLDAASTLAFELDAPGGTHDKLVVFGDLTLDGTLEVSDLGDLHTGSYVLLSYTGTLTDAGLDVTPIPGKELTLDMSEPTWVQLLVVDIFELDYSAGPNGTLTGTLVQNVNDGEDGTAVTAVPDNGYMFVRWSDGSTANPRIDTNVSGDLAVTAEFVLEPVEETPLEIDGDYENTGVLYDVVIRPGATLRGGRLGGDIVNHGTIRDVRLLPGTTITGGTLAGAIIGTPSAPAVLIDVRVAAGTELHNVILSGRSVIHPLAVLVTNVRVETLAMIPAGLRLNALLPAITGAFNPALAALDLDSLLTGDAEDTVLAGLRLPAGLPAAAAFEQDPLTGELRIAGAGFRAVLLPFDIRQGGGANADSVPVGTDGAIVLPTATGQQLASYPLPGDLDELRLGLAVLGMELAFDEAARLIVTRVPAIAGQPRYLARAGAAAVPAAAGRTPGLHFRAQPRPLNTLGITLVYTDASGALFEQELVPAPADWAALKARLQVLPGAGEARIDAHGVISLTLAGRVLRGIADYAVLPDPAGANRASVEFSPAGDRNGDGVADIVMAFPDGYLQVLYLLP